MNSPIVKTESRQLSASSLSYLFHHIMNGFRSSHEGIVNAKNKGILTTEEVSELLIKNGDRLINRIIEFKLAERVTCLVFAALFGFMQVTSGDLEMRRGRSGRSRRRQESHQII